MKLLVKPNPEKSKLNRTRKAREVTSNQKIHLADLPPEILFKILNDLDVISKRAIHSTSSYLREIAVASANHNIRKWLHSPKTSKNEPIAPILMSSLSLYLKLNVSPLHLEQIINDPQILSDPKRRMDFLQRFYTTVKFSLNLFREKFLYLATFISVLHVRIYEGPI